MSSTLATGICRSVALPMVTSHTGWPSRARDLVLLLDPDVVQHPEGAAPARFHSRRRFLLLCQN